MPPKSTDLDYRPSYLAAAIASLVIFALYLATLAPSTAMWDTSEYIAAAYTLGLPHPPGNPLFVLIGRVFAILPARHLERRDASTSSRRSAARSPPGMWFLVTERVLVGWLAERWQRISAARLAALIGATAFTVWNQSVVNEKVYTVSLMGLAIISWLMIRWSRRSRRSEGGPPARARRVSARPRLRESHGGLARRAGRGGGGGGSSPAHVPPLEAARREHRCAAARHHAVSHAAHSRRALPGDQRGRADHLELRSCYNFNRGQYGKPALLDRQAPFARTARHVLAVLQVAVAARRAGSVPAIAADPRA